MKAAICSNDSKEATPDRSRAGSAWSCRGPRFPLECAPMSHKWTVLALAGALAGLSLTNVAASTEGQAAAQRGIEAYLAGRYDQALPELEKARDAGESSGALLYMLGFCYESVSHDSTKSAVSFDASMEALKKEVERPKPQIESYFYLSNLYLNRNDAAGSKKAATVCKPESLPSAALTRKPPLASTDGSLTAAPLETEVMAAPPCVSVTPTV